MSQCSNVWDGPWGDNLIDYGRGPLHHAFAVDFSRHDSFLVLQTRPLQAKLWTKQRPCLV
jgi:hypothetical protein